MKLIYVFFISLLFVSCSTVSETETFSNFDETIDAMFVESDENPNGSPWTLVVVPDTQHYTADWRKAPYSNMETAFSWIAANVEKLNIKMVQGLGDNTENWDNFMQWQKSAAAWQKLRGKVLYMPALGNHDDPNMFNSFFPVSDFSGLPWFGGYQGGSENIYFIMTLGGVDYLFLTLDTYDQYSKHRPEGLQWAKGVIESHPDRKVILATHDLWSTQTVRNEILERYPNVVLANAGHSCVREQHYRANNAETFIIDYQCDASEVMKIRYYTFHPKENLVRYYTFSPVTGQFESDFNSEGSFHFMQQ